MDLKSYNFKNKRALVRVDFNVPIDNNGNVTDNTRIKMAIPTLEKIINDGGSIVLMSHLGRPNDEPNKEFSLSQIIPSLESFLEKKIIFCSDCISDDSFKTTKNLENGSVVLLENLRFHKEEKNGDKDFEVNFLEQ